MSARIPTDDILTDIRRVAADLGRAPTVADYREYGEYTVPTAARPFDGSFVKAREAADVAEGELRPNSREELLADIRAVADEVGGEPSKDEYKEHGEYALSGITYRFESWVDAKKEAGVFDGGLGSAKNVSKELIIQDLRRVDATTSGPVSQVKYNQDGNYTVKTAQRYFGSWEEACQEAGVTRPDKGPRTEETSELIEDIRQVADSLGRPPSRGEYNRMGDFSRQMAIDRLGSWPEAVRRAGYEPRKPGGQPGEENSNWRGGYEPYYGRNWHEQRRAARRRDGYECVACRMTESDHVSKYGWGLEVHHIVPVREFEVPEDANTLDNLITLCRPHHRKYEELPAIECEKLMN